MPSKYKLVSSQQAIAKLYRDLRLTDSRYVTDMIEWIGEAMEHIRVYPTLIKKAIMLPVEMHRTEIPSDVALFRQIMRTPDKGKTLQPMEYNASHFPQNLFTREVNNTGIREQQNRYIINGGYIETTFEEGDIVVSYMAFPQDDEGWPMIPEEISFREALKWYVALRMTEGGWKHPARLDYNAIEQRWHHYCAQARQKAKMPDIDQYQKFLELWVRLVPDYSRYQFGFDDFRVYTDDVVDASGIVVRGVDQVSHFGTIEDESPSPA